MQYTSRIAENNPRLADSLAGNKMLFGKRKRYAVAPMHTRFDAVSWCVFDAMTDDPLDGSPAVIRQENSFEAAIADLS